jgi:oligopeptide transport system substrate-binding protein
VTDLGVKAIDDNTFEVTLSEPVPYFYKLLVHPSVSPVPKAAVEKFGEKWTQPANIVTNGAYKLKDWVVNERIDLVRNTNYWDNAKTVINQVTYLPISSEVTDVNRYRSGEIDMTYNNMPIELFQKLKKEIPAEVHVDPYLCTYYYEINNQKAPFNDVRVRTALKLALDRDIIVNKVKNQGDLPAKQPSKISTSCSYLCVLFISSSPTSGGSPVRGCHKAVWHSLPPKRSQSSDG